MHENSKLRKVKGTHLWPIDRITHPLAHRVPLALDHGLDDQKSYVSAACSDNFSLLLTECGQVHAFKHSKSKKQNIISRVPLRSQVKSIAAGRISFCLYVLCAKSRAQ